jgi:tetratricopeptide (TPR) repeat protein
MDSETKSAVDWYKILGWLDQNKQRLLLYGGAAIVVGVLVSYIWYNANQKEPRASQALSDIVLPQNLALAAPESIEALLKVETDHPGTGAAERAVLQAAGYLFQEGRYADAQKLFERFERTYLESTLRSQAMIGVAACLDGQQKTTEAVAAYEKLQKAYPNDVVSAEGKLGLARLYERQNKLPEAFGLFQEILRANPPNQSTLGAEAYEHYQNLMQTRPDLLFSNLPPRIAPVSTNRPMPALPSNVIQVMPTSSIPVTQRVAAPTLPRPTTPPAAPPPPKAATNRPALAPPAIPVPPASGTAPAPK